MNHADLITELLAAPGAVYDRECALATAKLAVSDAKAAVAETEATWLLMRDADTGNPVLNGRNEAERQAQLRGYTAGVRDALRVAECEALIAEREYNAALNRFRALRSVAALLAGAEEERRAA